MEEVEDKIVELFANLPYDEMEKIFESLKEIKNEKYFKLFKIVKLITGRGNVSWEISDKYKLNSWHKLPVRIGEGCCGTNYVEIPIERYTDELVQELKDKYDKWQ